MSPEEKHEVDEAVVKLRRTRLRQIMPYGIAVGVLLMAPQPFTSVELIILIFMLGVFWVFWEISDPKETDAKRIVLGLVQHGWYGGPIAAFLLGAGLFAVGFGGREIIESVIHWG